ncbi:MAG: single-stranded-DNA-specific exonuclease RecJ [Clostridia bacterium]|nr:single-stranded-DNA-specific exonuclease RecJ [Clostridia bacterium]
MENYFLGSGKRWVFSECPERVSLGFKQDVPELLQKLLFQRKITNKEEAITFLNPTLEALHDPFLMEGMDLAADRIIRAITQKERILVYGDYDVDGVSATSILVQFFESMNAPIEYYIPDRVDEGYGISDAAVDYISSHDFELVITVDCGITARFQVDAIYERYSQKGKTIDIIITDHHQWNEQLMPEALVVLNPHIPTSRYPFKNLCGAGLALKLVQAIGAKLQKPNAYHDYLDLAALATIADIVELNGENRIITKFGIEKIVKNPSIGMQALLKAAGVESLVDSYRVSFALAPRVNAAGRMGDAKRAVSLFTTKDLSEAEKIALLLNESNTKRQEVQDQIFKSAVQVIEKDARYRTEKVLVVHGTGWHHGVIGIVASKLVDRYHKPAIVLSVEEDKAVGSGRSIEGFNLFSAMEAVSNLLVKYGGHEQAGGLTLMAEDIEYFRVRINAYADDLIQQEMLQPTMTIHLPVNGKEVNLRTAKLLSRLEPFGSGNQMPLFCLKGAVILNKKVIGNGKHLKLTLGMEGQPVEGVYFNKGELDKAIVLGDKVDVVFSQEVNVWQNSETLQLKLYDLRLEEAKINRNRFLVKLARQVECLDCDENWLYNGIIDETVSLDDIKVNRDDLVIIYRYITKTEIKAFSLAELFIHARTLEQESKRNINCFKLLTALLVFDELELLSLELQQDGSYKVTWADNARKVNLEDSEILDWLREATEGLSRWKR